MTPYYEDDAVTIYHGDCREILPTLRTVAAVVTSPPYAMQRANQYGGISEAEYPLWTAGWMGAVPLAADGSVIVNIRPHIRNGVLSDYVLRTRVELISHGWGECEELVWFKPNGAGPFGSLARPRRAWESLLWFARSGDVWCDPKANGTPLRRAERSGSARKGEAEGYIGGRPARMDAGDDTRCMDVVSVPVGGSCDKTEHPATYPVKLAAWALRLVTPPDGVVVDPFLGSGTTLRAAKDNGRKAIGIELSERYCEIAAKRMAQEVLAL